ncbi:hypothetical protein H0H92_000483 [Tricholoma furcatifolium]|nr:hypothetical protein H0H92_000483 [Tricholoma furcatifolium]
MESISTSSPSKMLKDIKPNVLAAVSVITPPSTAPPSSGATTRRRAADIADKKLKENYAPGGHAKRSGHSREVESVSVVLKRKSDDNLSAAENFIKKARVDLTAAEARITELTKTNELLHSELMTSKKETTRLAHVLRRVKAALSEVEEQK